MRYIGLSILGYILGSMGSMLLFSIVVALLFPSGETPSDQWLSAFAVIGGILGVVVAIALMKRFPKQVENELDLDKLEALKPPEQKREIDPRKLIVLLIGMIPGLVFGVLVFLGSITNAFSVPARGGLLVAVVLSLGGANIALWLYIKFFEKYAKSR